MIVKRKKQSPPGMPDKVPDIMKKLILKKLKKDQLKEGILDNELVNQQMDKFTELWKKFVAGEIDKIKWNDLNVK